MLGSERTVDRSRPRIEPDRSGSGVRPAPFPGPMRARVAWWGRRRGIRRTPTPPVPMAMAGGRRTSVGRLGRLGRLGRERQLGRCKRMAIKVVMGVMGLMAVFPWLDSDSDSQRLDSKERVRSPL